MLIIFAGQTSEGTAKLQRFNSGIIIGGKLISGPGHICFGAINCGNGGTSGILK